MEFYLWGNATLETELHQPKNDRILFTFFGISNVHRRRSRATEIRSEVTNKNRVTRALGDNASYSWVLARDSKDIHYPYESQYSDFDQNPRWKDYEVVEIHPRGVIVSMAQCYAWFDEDKKLFDIAEPPLVPNNPYNQHHDFERDRESRDAVDLVRDYWERLPRKNQAMFHRNGIIRFKDMLVIDDKGDSWNKFPHIFVDFIDGSPVSGTLGYLMKGERQISLDDFSKSEIFPKSFPVPQFGTIYDQDGLALPDKMRDNYLDYRGNLGALYDVDGRFAYLNEGDVAVIRSGNKDDRFIQITHRYKLLGDEMLREQPHLAWQVEAQIERKLTSDDVIDVLEFRNCYARQWQNR